MRALSSHVAIVGLVVAVERGAQNLNGAEVWSGMRIGKDNRE